MGNYSGQTIALHLVRFVLRPRLSYGIGTRGRQNSGIELTTRLTASAGVTFWRNKTLLSLQRSATALLAQVSAASVRRAYPARPEKETDD